MRKVTKISSALILALVLCFACIATAYALDIHGEFSIGLDQAEHTVVYAYIPGSTIYRANNIIYSFGLWTPIVDEFRIGILCQISETQGYLFVPEMGFNPGCTIMLYASWEPISHIFLTVGYQAYAYDFSDIPSFEAYITKIKIAYIF